MFPSLWLHCIKCTAFAMYLLHFTADQNWFTVFTGLHYNVLFAERLLQDLKGGLHVWYQLLHCLLQKSILVAYQHFFLGCISTLFSQKWHTFARILKNTELHWRKASIENWWYVDLQFRSNGLFCKKTRECWSRSLCVDSHSVTVTFYHTVVHCADNTPQKKEYKGAHLGQILQDGENAWFTSFIF